MSSTIISLAKVSKQYSGSNKGGVSDIDLEIREGEFVGIIGESGSGKSTLLKLIYGLLGPDEGKVVFRGTAVLGPHEKLIPGHPAMKIVSQDFNLNSYAKVYDNIASMLSNEDLASKKEKTLEMMEFLKIEHLAEKRTVELSGGEQQRVAIARAIITQPEVLLLDEPFSQIDTIMKHELRDDLRRLSMYLGITIILVSHDPMDGLSLADKIVILKDGKLVQSGEPLAVVNHPGSAYVASLLGDANVFSASTANQIFKLPLEESQSLVIYPHHLQLSSKGVRGTVKKVLYKLIHDEVTIDVGGVDITCYLKTSAARVGEAVTIVCTAHTIVKS